MAETLNWILNDSQRGAEVYSELIEDSGMDQKMWDFVEMRKDHEQIVGHVKRTLAQIGAEPGGKTRNIWPQLKKDPARRVYEDTKVLKALRDAEKAELEDCEKLMSTGESDRMVHTFVATNVMPVINGHIETLDRYLHRAQAING